MPITPLDIRKKTFATGKFRGIDPKEVKDFLEQVARDTEAVYKERTLLAEKVDELSAKLEGFTRSEKAFQEAFLTAQQACAEQRENAKREAANILERAKLEGEKVARDAQDEVATLDQDVSTIRLKKMALLSEFRALIDGFTKMVEHWEAQEKSRKG